METKKILVGVDFSSGSDTAVRQALDLARHVGAELCLVHVGVILEHPEDIPGAGSMYAKVARDQLAADRVALEELRGRISGQGVEVSHMVLDGYADNAIVDLAGEMGAYMIVVGSHGRSGVRRLLLGSVAERVVRLATTSVLVARPGSEAGGGYRRILVPTDFSRSAARALDLALEVAAPTASIDLLHCWQLPVPPAGHMVEGGAAGAEYQAARETVTAGIAGGFARLIEQHPGIDVDLRTHTIEESPVHGIQRWLETTSYQLVVTGSHGRRGFRRFLLGSVAEATVRHAPCSVLVAHGAR